jgi:hypothetical protein
LADLPYVGLSPHLKEKIESWFFDVSQFLQRALECENWAKESTSFPTNDDNLRNDHHVNKVEYESESSNDEEGHMCVAEWNWASKSKPFVCSGLKSVSKNW